MSADRPGRSRSLGRDTASPSWHAPPAFRSRRTCCPTSRASWPWPLPDATMVEDVEDASFAALGALAQPSGVHIERGQLRADTALGHGLVFATGGMEELGP